jgi:multiple sugar transport system permease protein
MGGIMSKKKRISIPAVILMIILGLYTVSVFIPLLWGFMVSFKSRTNFVEFPFGFPDKLVVKNYWVAIENFSYTLDASTGETVYIGGMLLNTLLYSLGCAFFSTMSACIVAYATSKFNFFTDKIIYTIVIVTMALPIIGSAPSELHVAKTLGIFDSHIGMWIMKSSFLGMYYLIFYAIFKGIPKDYNDAAAVDGASHYRVFFTIILPLASKTFSTVYLLYFIGFWNDYQTPLIYMPSFPTLAMGLYSFTFANNSATGSVPVKMAGNFLIFIPILIVFIAFKNKLLGNVSMGGIKE